MAFVFNDARRRNINVVNIALLLAWLVALGYVGWASMFGLSRPRVSVSDAPLRGPVIARGRLIGTADRTTLSGQPASAWRSWVELSSPTYRFGEARCVMEEVGGLRLLDGRGALQVSTELFPPKDGRFPSPIDEPAFGPHEKRAPDSLASRCPPGALTVENQVLEGVSVPYAHLRYFEFVIPPDTEVEISACREGEMLRPCGDGGDEIDVHLRERGFRGRARSFPENAQLLGWLGWIFAVLGSLTAAWVVYARVSNR